MENSQNESQKENLQASDAIEDELEQEKEISDD